MNAFSYNQYLNKHQAAIMLRHVTVTAFNELTKT